MNIQEEIEKAFIAGAEFMREECWTDSGEDAEMPFELEVERAAIKYTNEKVGVGS